MSGAKPDYYNTLGLSPTASPEEVKRRYRELARRYHPDVNPSPEASHKIKAINEAHHVLGDADRRALYDAERFLSAKSPPRPAPTGPAASPPPRADRPSGPGRSPGANSRVEFNGFGRATARPQQTSYSSAKRPSGDATRRATIPFGQAERLLAEAQLAFVNRRYREAETFCLQILNIDRRNASAHEIMGDINVKRGRPDSATIAYSYAIQYNPRNVSAQTKLERLMGKRREAAPGPILTTRPAATWEQFSDGPYRDLIVAVLTIMLSLMFCGTLALIAFYPGAPLLTLVPWLSQLSFMFYVALAFTGVFAGVLLAFHGRMRPLSEELMTRRILPDNRESPVTLGVLLSLFALVSFYASLLVYVGICVVRNRVSLSVMRAYGLTLLLTALCAALCRPIGPYSIYQAVGVGGNLLFPGVLFGWALGDFIRLPGSMTR